MLNDVQIDQVRRVVRLELLRSSIFSLATESLDAQVPRLVVDVAIVDDQFEASISYLDSTGAAVSGGSL